MKLLRATCLVSLLIVTAAGAIDANGLDESIRRIAAASDPLSVAVDRGFAVRDERVQVVAVTNRRSTRDLESWLVAQGATFVLAVGDRVQAFVPPGILADLGRHPHVVLVERPLYAELPEPVPEAASARTKTLAVTSEGLEVMNVAAWHADGFSGAGARIGVVDVQFDGWDDLLGVELPPAGRTIYRSFGGASIVSGEVHGTGCAEIAHDIAPDAELYLAHIRTLNDFFAALDWMASEGVDVVTMSIGWYGAGPGDGTGRIANEISSFVAVSDAVVFISAGNERRSHWQGETVDGDGDDWVDFASGDDLNELSFSMAAGDRVAVNISWSDWSSPTSDYSLHLFNLDGAEPEEVAVSDRSQTGQSFQTPYEQISYTAADGGRFGVRINRAGVFGTHDMELFSADSDLNNRVAEGSLVLPADAADVMAVAAVNFNSPYSYRSFSSAGPTNGPGGILSGGSTKPDLSGYDGVSTVSYGARNFFGTSAASPHAAGAAALVRAADPSLSSDEVRDYLETRARDLGASGMDNDYGWGRVALGQTPGSDCAFAIDPTESSVGSEGGLGIIRVTTDDGCPWTASSRVEWVTAAPASSTSSGVVGYTVDANLGPPRSGEIVVADLIFTVSQAGAAPGHAYLVAGVAETEGLEQTRWKSDLALLNPGGGSAAVDLVYRHGGGQELSSVTVGPGEIIELVNVAAVTFGVSDSVGAVEVLSDAPLIVTSRTYNDTPDGTFGQFVSGVTESDGLTAGGSAVLSQLTGNDDFRTNIGFVDLGGGGAVARIRLFDGDGSAVGSELGVIIPPGGWSQRDRVFHATDAGDCSGCYAVIDSVEDGGLVWAYASVVDNRSGDPTTIPMELMAGAESTADERYLVAGIAETDGAGQTTWKSNLALLNLSGRGVTADLVYRHDADAETSSVTLAAGELREFENVAAGLFGASGSSGAVDVDADGPLVVTARTFNDAPAGTFGQFLPGLGISAALATGDEGNLSQLKSTDRFRTNIGFTSFGEDACAVRISLYDDRGEPKGVLHSTVPAGGWVQENRVFEAAGVSPCPLGYAVVEVLTDDCEVWAYASVVDNGSGDPTTVPVVIHE